LRRTIWLVTWLVGCGGWGNVGISISALVRDGVPKGNNETTSIGLWDAFRPPASHLSENFCPSNVTHPETYLLLLGRAARLWRLSNLDLPFGPMRRKNGLRGERPIETYYPHLNCWNTRRLSPQVWSRETISSFTYK
jgi:hypothetical protein